MKKADLALENLRHLVTLTSIAPSLRGPQRVAIDRMITDLTERVGPVVPKRRAAAILNISTQALDTWLKRGRLQVAQTSQGSRVGVDTAALVWTANQIPAGTARPGRVVDRARALTRRREEFWRFNEAASVAEGQAFATLSFAERIVQLDAHYATINALAAVKLRSRAPVPTSEAAVAR
jgi:hypothetical protein